MKKKDVKQTKRNLKSESTVAEQMADPRQTGQVVPVISCYL